MHFRQSHSSLQCFATLPPEKQPESSSLRELWKKTNALVDNRLNEENWLGTLVIPLAMYKATYTTRVAYNTVDGEPKIDAARQLAKQLFILEKIWAFFSARGAAYPEGKNFPERVANAILHPQKSSLQLEYILLLPSRLMTLYSLANVPGGLGIIPEQTITGPHKLRQAHAAVSLLWITLLGIGHFRTRRASTDEKEALAEPENAFFARSQSAVVSTTKGEKPQLEKLDIKHVLKNAWKYDKPLLAGLGLEAFAMPFLNGLEAWYQSDDKSTSQAIGLARGVLSGAIIASAYSIYTLQRISKSNFKRKEDEGKTPESPEITKTKDTQYLCFSDRTSKTFAQAGAATLGR